MNDSFPDNSDVDAEVLMNEHVPHRANVSPRHSRPERGDIVVQVGSGLADDLEVADDSVKCLLVLPELDRP